MLLQKYSYKILKEIALVALTYRVSYKTIAKMFNTTIEDVQSTFRNLDDFSISLYYLDRETINEDEISERKAYECAKLYFKKRNELYKKLKDSSENREDIIKEIDELHHDIDDYHISILKNKTYYELSEIDREKIARYRLKYYLSRRNISSCFKIDKTVIPKIEQELAQKDPIYSRKLELLNYTYDRKNQEYGKNVVRKSR